MRFSKTGLFTSNIFPKRHPNAHAGIVVSRLPVRLRDHGSVNLRGAINEDWEDLASFKFNGRPLLLIADVGDIKEAGAVMSFSNSKALGLALTR